jgi:hypothetical protein
VSYHPYGGRDPYGPHDGSYQRPDDHPYREPRHDGASTVASVVRLATGLVVTVFLLHILFVVLHANRGNEFVSLVYLLAKTFVLGLGDVFTPRDAMLGVVLNYALAALVYLVVGQLVVKALRRH